MEVLSTENRAKLLSKSVTSFLLSQGQVYLLGQALSDSGCGVGTP